MSIIKVEVTNEQGTPLVLSLEDNSNGYDVLDISGLDPVKSSIVTSSFANIEGQQYQASSRDVRNIVFKLGYNPYYESDQTVRELRKYLYQFFMTGTPVKLRFFMTDGLVVNTSGRVESCEAPLFSQEPEVNVSIVCFDPDFIDDSLSSAHAFLSTDTTYKPVMYTGTVATGVTAFFFRAYQATTEFTIYHVTPSGESRNMTIAAPLANNDLITMNTVRGQKSITKTKTGNVIEPIMWAVSPSSKWLELKPGLNQVYIHASGTAASPIYIDYYNRYGGL